MKRSFRIDQISTNIFSLLPHEWLFRIRSIAVVLPLACVLINCSWTPQVETVLHDTPQARVSLRTVSDETFRTSHPIDIPDTIIIRILQGLQKQLQVGLLQTLVTGNPQPTPVFSPSQVTYLAPLIKNAFEQATPEEEVYFRLTRPEGSAEQVEGSIFVYGPNVVFAVKSTTARSTLKNTQSTNISQITFSPPEAISPDDLSHIPYIQQMRRHSVLIHYKKIGTHKPNHKDPSVNTIKAPVAPHAPTSSITPVSNAPLTSPKQAAEISTKLSTPIQQLHEQMEILKKQLGEQKAEIERLKKLQR